jgi:membrane protein YqaA with SNARE-associated domain
VWAVSALFFVGKLLRYLVWMFVQNQFLFS